MEAIHRMFTFLAVALACPAVAQHVPFTANETVTWEACIREFQALDESSDVARLTTFGSTDVGKPLHLFIINKDKVFYPELFDRKKTIVLINNAIHPGEPDGVDASLVLCRELLAPASPMAHLLDSVILCIVPMYNVDGALNRSAWSRVNQDGPEEYGFRGNGRNLDLNRDFIKCDSENARSFNRMFTRVLPHVFVDTHVSNGADYPYTMTLITTQPDKLGPAGDWLRGVMEPALFAGMEKRGWKMCPYVFTMGRSPETGLIDFLETPRFSTGYGALYNALGFVTETHMLKPFPQRVESTYHFFCTLLEFCDTHANRIVREREAADLAALQRASFPLRFELDSTHRDSVRFDGYTPVQERARIGTGQRTRYDHDRPWTDHVPFWNRYRGTREVVAPRAYVVPQAWREVTERLIANHVQYDRLERDTVMEVEYYRIVDVTHAGRPYEGHYLHEGVTVLAERGKVQLYAGDLIVPTQQRARRYLVETLEPEGEDSFFAWNFFDSVLQQKEWFSDYVFEDKAAELLATDAALRTAFDKAMAEDAQLQASHWQQLLWIYRNSPYYEGSAFRYPVYRLP